MALVTSRRPSENSINNKPKPFKVIVIGESNVGKTTLTYRFCEGKFLDQSVATIGLDFRTKHLEIDGETGVVTLQLWDTAGQERHKKSMVPYYYRNTDAVAFVYDATNMASFMSLEKWVEEFYMYCSPDVPKILIGNKCDGVMAVSTYKAQKFADQHNMPLFETSAKLDSQCDNVDSIFLTLAHKLKNQKRYFANESSGRTIKTEIVNDTTQNKSWWDCC